MKIESFPREIWAWALYDFANSSYSTALAGVIFNVYFVQVVVGPQGISLFGSQITSSAVWGYVVSFSMLAVAVSAPVLGAIADHNALKKKFLLVFCYLGVLSTSFLFLVSGGDVWLAIIFYVVSSMTLEWSLVFYNGFFAGDCFPRAHGQDQWIGMGRRVCGRCSLFDRQFGNH